VSHRVHVVPRLRRFGQLLLPNWVAITIGRDIFAARELDDAELRHELAHVAQWRHYGWTLAPRYALASWRGWRSGRGWYDGNRFEIEARAAAGRSAQDEPLPRDDTVT
jgi:hypothetical protein